MTPSPYGRRTVSPAVVAVFLLAGCGVADDHANTPRGRTVPPASSVPSLHPQAVPGAPQVATINMQDPTAVARATVITMSMIDTTTDDPRTNNHDAMLRAIPYLTPTYATRIRAEQTFPAPAAVWQDWTSHRAYLHVRLSPAATETPPDTETTARRAWTITTTPTGRDHWHATLVTGTAAFVTLTRPNRSQPWRVDRVDTG